VEDPILWSSGAVFAETEGRAPSEAEGEESAVLHDPRKTADPSPLSLLGMTRL